MIKVEIQEKTNTYEEMANVLREIAKMLDEGYTSGYYVTWKTEKEIECTLKSIGHICFRDGNEYFSLGGNIWESPMTSFMNDEGFRKDAIYFDPDKEGYRDFHGFPKEEK